MIQLATPDEHIAGANYVVHTGGQMYSCETIEEVWHHTGKNWQYSVSSPVGLDVSGFIPF